MGSGRNSCVAGGALVREFIFDASLLSRALGAMPE
jgi:hypothetical protein